MSAILLFMIGLPLVGSVLNGLVLKPVTARQAGVIATFFAGGSLVSALILWRAYLSNRTPVSYAFEWLTIGELTLKWGFTCDALTLVMCLVVTGIGTLIHLYSIAYMSDDKTPSRYFAYLNLFLFNMLLLVCGDNLITLFVGWEGVGLCSYLLIGYWYDDLKKSNAGMKAFVVNRIGDAGFLMGIFLCFVLFGSVQFTDIAKSLATSSDFDLRLLNFLGLFLFVGAMGKSAQIPLYVWLPDAMAGPTPVSALIHAATMVTAGVYLIARMGFLYQVTAETNAFISIIGISTALLAAFIATSQRDIKKVLAYSTVSQLGLMFLALGSRAYVASIFHVFTHAFFKALLFLGSGSVIHALHGEQDICKMGGLQQKLPWTYLTFAIGTFAIAGIPPLAGFFSKDTILYHALGAPNGMLFWTLGLLVSLLTAFYMARLFALVFLGKFRGDSHSHPHESGPVMLIPLFVLAIGSVLAGFLGVPHGLHWIPNVLTEFLSGTVVVLPEPETVISELSAMGVATAVAVIGTGLGLWLYANPQSAESLSGSVSPLRLVLSNKFFIDEFYDLVFMRPFKMVSVVLAKFVDVYVIDGLVLFPAKLARAGGTLLSFVQQGVAQMYLLWMLLGTLIVFWLGLRGWVW